MRYEFKIAKIIRDREYYEKMRDFYAAEKMKEKNQYYRDLYERYN